MTVTKRNGIGRRWMRSRKGAAAAVVLVLGGVAALALRQALPGGRPAAAVAPVRYQCPMHPQIVRDRPGDCPICHMHLERMESPAGGRTILRYRHPMRPDVFSATPRKDEMGMDYVPIYADEAGGKGGGSDVPGKSGFTLSAHRRQLIGVKTVRVAARRLVKTVRLPGRVSNDGGVILAQLLEIDAGHVAAGMSAVAVGPEGQEVPADVSQVDNALDTLTRSFAVTLQTREKDAWLRAGVFCEVRVTRELGERLAIPADAVLNTGDQQVVFVALPDGRFEPRKVALGREGDELVEVRKGLKEGDEVVSAANFLIDSESRFRAALDQF